MQHPEEGRPGEQGAQPLLLGAATDDHQCVAGSSARWVEQLELLLGGEPADVPDEQAAVGRDPAAAARRSGAPGWNACRSTPRGHSAVLPMPRSRELAQAGRGRSQRPVHREVDPPGQRGHRPDAARHVVAGREADQVGLVDRHRGDAELGRRPGRLVAQGGRRGDVDDVGPEPAHHRAQPAPGLEPDPEVGVEREVRAARVRHREPGVRRRPGRGDQLRLVPLGRQVLQHPAYRVRHPVDLGKEGLRHHQHPQLLGHVSGR